MAVRVAPRFVEWPERAGGVPVAFRCTSGGARTELRADGFAATLVTGARDSSVGARLAFAFEGGKPNIRLESGEVARGTSHIFRGTNPNSWSPDLRAFRTLREPDAYPEVDIVWYFNDAGDLEYDLRLAAGADPSSIVVRVDGADSLAIDDDGALRIATPLGAIRQTAPIATQESASGDARRVACAFRLLDSQRYAFAVEGHDSARALRIDPGIVYATLYGDTTMELGSAMDVDSSGSVYFGGKTDGKIPTTPGAFDTTFNAGGYDAFLAKLDPTGGILVYSTYVGGSWMENCSGLSVDGSGCATIGVTCGPPELPTTPGCYQSQAGGGYVAKLDPTGSALVFGTKFGGMNTALWCMAVDSQGNCCLGGDLITAELPATPGAFSTTYGGGSSDSYVAKLDPTGSTLVYATYIGGANTDNAWALTTDPTGAVFLTGETVSANFPTVSYAYQPLLNGAMDAFITKIAPSGASLAFSTYIGGSLQTWGSERGTAIALDSFGCAHVAVQSYVPDFPLTPGGVDMGPPVAGPASFLVKLSWDASTLIYSDRFVCKNSNGFLQLSSIAIDPAGNAVLCGSTYPPHLQTPEALSYTPGKYDAFVTVLSPLGRGLTYSTLWGASKNDGFLIGKLDSQGNAYLLGGTFSPDIPTTPGAYDTTYSGGDFDALVVKMTLRQLPYGTASYGSGLAGCYGPQTLRTEASLKVGNKTMTLECDNVPSNWLGLIIVSDVQDVVGSDLLFLGVPFHVGLSPNACGINIVSNNSIIADVIVPLPNLAPLVGMTFYAQAFWRWPQSTCAPSLWSISASKGLAVTVLP